MIETFLALVPDYGLIIVTAIVFLACLAVPLPASIIVLTAGSFAATGDLSVTHVLLSVFGAYVAGDQVAYWTAATIGEKAARKVVVPAKYLSVLEKSRDLLDRRGVLAVLLSHTVISPLGPFVAYVCGAGGLDWYRYTLAAVFGALVWTSCYVMFGMLFASHLEQVGTLLGYFIGVALTVTVLTICFLLLRNRWREHNKH